MQLLFRLPFLLLETAVRQGLAGIAALNRLIRGEDDSFAPAPSAAPPEPPRSFTGTATAPSAPPAPAPPTAEEAIRRRTEREAAAAPPPPAPTPVADAPSRRRRNGAAPGGGHVDREATVVESVGPAEDVRGTITVDEPWEGYDEMAASAIVARLRGSDEATRGVVRLYERMHKNRATVVRATG